MLAFNNLYFQFKYFAITGLCIYKSITNALGMIEMSSNGMIYDESDLKLVVNPVMARAMGQSLEMRDYIK